MLTPMRAGVYLLRIFVTTNQAKWQSGLSRTTKVAWSHPDDSLEDNVHVLRVRKTTDMGDLLDRQIGFRQQLFGAFELDVSYLLLR